MIELYEKELEKKKNGGLNPIIEESKDEIPAKEAPLIEIENTDEAKNDVASANSIPKAEPKLSPKPSTSAKPGSKLSPKPSTTSATSGSKLSPKPSSTSVTGGSKLSPRTTSPANVKGKPVSPQSKAPPAKPVATPLSSQLLKLCNHHLLKGKRQ
jgi:hypothetical protein